ncbi:hypothetical protein AAW31_00010 [Nitrosomonas communis]|uniref:Uncharacterized protein n=1 Tax=Nitrosomonas communis TaxID=44574 RepID=A0A0F7KCN1_9PROT|nr:hypothetical protein AAW31_00010 [Nitrosomonas communis]
MRTASGSNFAFCKQLGNNAIEAMYCIVSILMKSDDRSPLKIYICEHPLLGLSAYPFRHHTSWFTKNASLPISDKLRQHFFLLALSCLELSIFRDTLYLFFIKLKLTLIYWKSGDLVAALIYIRVFNAMKIG